MSFELSIEISRVLQSRGHLAYLVGGCVRDRLLGNLPKDYDIATDATPAEVTRYFPAANQVGAHFGVVLIRDATGAQVEVATFRTEDAYTDGRRPDRVEFETDPAQDVFRRDFTINALLENPVTGEVIDLVGGRDDLSKGVIRAIGDPERRFREDHLRMLRAARFAARLQFRVEPLTMKAIRELAHLTHTVSAERVRSEIVRILTEGHPRRGFELLDESGLLEVVLPEVKRLQGVEQPPQFHPEGDVWTHTLMMLGMLRHPSTTLALGVLLHDIGKPATFRVAERIRFDGHVEAGLVLAREILHRLRFSNDDCEQVLALIANHMRFKDVGHMRPSTLKRMLRLPAFAEHLELHRIDCLASNGNLENWEYVRQALQELPEEQIRPQRLLTGRDLIDAGFKPSPAFSKVLDDIETAQLDGQISSKDQALELAKKALALLNKVQALSARD